MEPKIVQESLLTLDHSRNRCLLPAYRHGSIAGPILAVYLEKSRYLEPRVSIVSVPHTGECRENKAPGSRLTQVGTCCIHERIVKPLPS